jgi:uncharacterized protein YjiS (DUF1127 family)
MHTISQRLTAFEATAGRIGAGSFRGLVRAAASRAFGTLLLWQRRANERHALDHLDDRILRDLGLNRAEIAWESRKPFWHA